MLEKNVDATSERIASTRNGWLKGAYSERTDMAEGSGGDGGTNFLFVDKTKILVSTQREKRREL